MAWNQITSGDVDYKSPMNATLWGKVKDNIDYLRDTLKAWVQQFELIDEIAETTYDITAADTWETHSIGEVWIPDFADEITFSLDVKGGSSGEARRVRVGIYDGSSWQNSSEHSPVQLPGTGYETITLAVPSAGSLSGQGAYRDWRVEVYGGQVGDTFYVRRLKARVTDASAGGYF